MTSTGRHTAVLCLLTLLGSRTSLAAAAGCATTVVAIDPAVRERWPGVPTRVSGVLAGHADVDPCARITIHLDGATMALEVLLADGRTASRSLSREDDVAPTLEALLLLPPAPRAPAEAPAAVAKAVAAPARPAPSGTTTIAGWSAGPAPFPGPRVRLEFSLATGARAGDGQKGFAVDALTLFDLRGWLVGFEAAVVHYEVDGDNVVQQAGTSGSQSPPPASDGPWARFLASSRVTFRLPSLVRPFVGVDADVALRRSSIAAASGERQLPAWVVGLVVGVTVGTP